MPKLFPPELFRPAILVSVLFVILGCGEAGDPQLAIGRKPQTASSTSPAAPVLGLTPLMLSSAAWTASYAGSSNASFGISVDFAGDFNHDGLKDVIVGAPLAGIEQRGRVYIAYGSATGLPPMPTATLVPPSTPANLFFNYGVIVRGIGDSNGDGFDDVVVVGIHTLPPIGDPAFEEIVYLYLGTPSGLGATPAWHWNAANGGSSVSIASGDLNGDGKMDLVISDPLRPNTNPGAGRVNVFIGKAGSTGFAAPISLNPLTAKDANFGSAVAVAKLRGSGSADLIVGAKGYSPSSALSGAGRAYVYRWPITTTSTPVWTADGDEKNGHFGGAVTAGDVNCDGLVDLLVGSPDHDLQFFGTTVDDGRVEVFYGSADGTPLTTRSLVSVGLAANVHYGAVINAQNDFDGDHCNDLVVGVHQEAASLANEGRVYVHRGSTVGLPFDGMTMDPANQANAGFGGAISTRSGDFNGDGVDDLVVGASGWKEGSLNQAGKVWVIRGRKDADGDNVVDFDDGPAEPYDNCPGAYNPDQRNSGGSPRGDVCECDPVVCFAADACHLVGVCEPSTGVCTSPVAPACMVAPSWPESTSLRAVEVATDHVRLEWTAASHPVAVSAYHVLRDGAEIAVVPASQTTYTATGLAPGTDYLFKLEAADALGDLSANGPSTLLTTVALPVTFPPGLSLDPTRPSTLGDLATGIYDGPNARQTGVDRAVLDPERVAIIRGKVVDRSGTPIEGMEITILGNPQYGRTTTNASGLYDIVVNGGETFAIVYKQPGYLSAQRSVQTRWNAWVFAEDLVATPYADPANPPTLVTLGDSGYQWAAGRNVSDVDGQRRARLLVPPGTTGVMRFADGHAAPLASPMSVRVTEYTEGAAGPQAMPAALPPSSAYTYLVEWDVDEATQRGATGVEFNQDVFMYVDNFLGFPQRADDPVPTGYYDRQTGTWIPMTNGRVVKVVSIDSTFHAHLDVTGDGLEDDVTLIGISEVERAQIAQIYGVNQSFWRTPLRHFTPVDCNWAFGLPGDARNPNGGPAGAEEENDRPCEHKGSIIECDDQILREEIPVAGTPWTLDYTSERAPGRSASRRIRIPLSGAQIPPSTTRMQVEIQVAGRRIRRDFPAAPGQILDYEWDGRDGLGRLVQGSVTAMVEVRWYFQAVYGPTPSFGGMTVSLGPISTVIRDGMEYYTFDRSFVVVGTIFNTAAQGLGGWSLSARQELDPVRNRLYHGDGTRVTADAVHMELRRWVGGGQGSLPASDASQAFIESPRGLAVAPDGTVYVTASHLRPDGGASGPSVLKVGPHGDISVLVTRTDVPGGTDGLGARMGALALGKNGDLYIGEEVSHRVFRRDARTGIVTVLAGTGAEEDSGDGGPATQAGLGTPRSLAVGPDGSVFIGSAPRIRRVDTSGVISSVTGLVNAPPQEGQLATQGRIGADAMAVAPSGNLYVCDAGAKKLYRISSNGLLYLAAGNGDTGTGDPALDGDGTNARTASLGGCDSVVVMADETVLVGERNQDTVRRIERGIMDTYAGTWNAPSTGTSLRTTKLNNPLYLAVGGNGDVFIGQQFNQGILRAHYFTGANGSVVEPDGSVVHEFGADGRHVRSLDTTTGRVLTQLAYDDHGRLKSVTDADGLVTTIVRDTSTGVPQAIVGPYGHRTILETDADGMLSGVTNAASERVSMTYWPDALLKSFTDARQHISTFQFDDDGRLTHDIDANGGDRRLTRPTTVSSRFVSAAGRVSEVAHSALADGTSLRDVTAQDGTVTHSRENRDRVEVTLPDGTAMSATLKDDPRFGPASRYVSKQTLAIPGLSPLTVDSERLVEGFDGTSPLSFARLIKRTIVNAAVSTSEYVPATRTLTFTSAEGRTSQVVLDPQGRVSRVRVPGEPDVVSTYDAEGRTRTMTTGVRTVTYEYLPAGRGQATAIIDSLGHRRELTYDAADRPQTLKAPDGGILTLGYDPSGNVSSVMPPGRPAHTFDYSGVDYLVGEHAPTVDGVPRESTFENDADGARRFTHNADGTTHEIQYDSLGRPSSLITPEGTTVLGYDDTSGLLTSMEHSGDVDLGYTFYGSLPRATSWAGEVNGLVTRTYDNFLIVSGVSVNGATPIVYTHDRDGLLTGAGAMTVSRPTATRRIAGSTLGEVVDSYTLSVNGDIDAYDVRIAGTTAYHVDHGHDDLGRIDTRTETIDDGTRTYEYQYDLAGRLEWTYVNGQVWSHYTYDGNGNRLSASSGGSTAIGVYDEQDRLKAYGGRTYQYDAQGNVQFITEGGATNQYIFDSSSTLRRVHLADGRSIHYVLDAAGRQVGKKVQAAGSSTAVLEQGFLYLDGIRPVAELNGSGQMVAQFVYASGHHVPDFMLKDGKTYRLITDHLGSPRIVVDVATGTIAQRMDFDEFGNVVTDTAPGFQPFGFAGGSYDVDTHLVRFGARQYDASVGRWMSRDPAGFSGGSANLYQYVNSDPVDFCDITGLAPLGMEWVAREYLMHPDVLVPDAVGVSGGATVVAGETGISIGLNIEFFKNNGSMPWWLPHLYLFYTAPRSPAAGFSIGGSCTGNVAWHNGNGDPSTYAGDFDEINASAGPLAGGYASGSGWNVISAGVGAGPPGLSYTKNTYVDLGEKLMPFIPDIRDWF